jgi:hypothetical protein
MSKKTPHALAPLKLSPKEKELIATFVESEAYKVLTKMVKYRELHIGVLLMSLGVTVEDLWFYKGKANESNHVLRALEKVSKEHKGEMVEEDDLTEDKV